MNTRFDRQSFLGKDSEEIISGFRIGIVGLGGGGSHIVQQLAHIGVGNFLLIDPDRIDATNLNRLVGGTQFDVWLKREKTKIAIREIKRVNSKAKIVHYEENWQNVKESLLDSDVIVGCLDSYGGRLELEAFARRYLIPYIDLGMDVFEIKNHFSISGQVTLSLPGKPCLRCMNVILNEWVDKEAAQYGAAGGKPQVIWPNGVLASLAVGIIIQLMTPWSSQEPSLLLEYDGNSHEVVKGAIVEHIEGGCQHFAAVDNLGDPWYVLKFN